MKKRVLIIAICCIAGSIILLCCFSNPKLNYIGDKVTCIKVKTVGNIQDYEIEIHDEKSITEIVNSFNSLQFIRYRIETKPLLGVHKYTISFIKTNDTWTSYTFYAYGEEDSILLIFDTKVKWFAKEYTGDFVKLLKDNS